LKQPFATAIKTVTIYNGNHVILIKLKGFANPGGGFQLFLKNRDRLYPLIESNHLNF